MIRKGTAMNLVLYLRGWLWWMSLLFWSWFQSWTSWFIPGWIKKDGVWAFSLEFQLVNHLWSLSFASNNNNNNKKKNFYIGSSLHIEWYSVRPCLLWKQGRTQKNVWSFVCVCLFSDITSSKQHCINNIIDKVKQITATKHWWLPSVMNHSSLSSLIFLHSLLQFLFNSNQNSQQRYTSRKYFHPDQVRVVEQYSRPTVTSSYH